MAPCGRLGISIWGNVSCVFVLLRVALLGGLMLEFTVDVRFMGLRLKSYGGPGPFHPEVAFVGRLVPIVKGLPLDTRL